MPNAALDAITGQSPMDWVKNAAVVLSIIAMMATGAHVIFGSLDNLGDVEAAVNQLSATIKEYEDESIARLESHRTNGPHPGVDRRLSLVEHDAKLLSADVKEILKEVRDIRIEISRRGDL